VDLEDIRLAVSLTFFIFWLWRFRNADDRFLQYVIIMIGIRLTFAALLRIRSFLQVRNARHRFRGLTPTLQNHLIERSWLSVSRDFYSETQEPEGLPEKDGNIERFPFSRTDRRDNHVAFWLVAALVLALYSVAFVIGGLPRSVAWALWITATLLSLLLAWLRSRDLHLGTVLESSPFTLTEIAEDGSRRTVQWSQPLWARNRPWLRRVEIRVAGRPEYIALDYTRLAIGRVFDLVEEYAPKKENAERPPGT